MTRIVTWETDTPPIGRAIVALGVFDGVHIGHRALIADTVEHARRTGVSSAVLTFDRDPDQVVTPERAAPQLLSLEDKVDLIAATGVDIVLVVPFCVRLAATTPERFLDLVVMQAFAPEAIVVGRDFRFGRHASGTVETLRTYGYEHGFRTIAHDLVTVDGEPVTSTRIRALITEGDVATAARLLGRLHRVGGRVVHGRGQGERVLGIPTANIIPRAHSALPADGVYAGRARIGDESYHAGISVGDPPTFPEAHHALEAHLLGFAGDLYATGITLEFIARLRAHERFDTPEALAAVIRADLRSVRQSAGGDR